jgi:hypothetical protein
VTAPRKHHLVAQLYQRGFARQRKKESYVLVLDRETGDGGVRNIRDVFAQRDWNTIVDADGNKLFGVEQLLADEIDGPVASVCRRCGMNPRFRSTRSIGWRSPPSCRRSSPAVA